MNYGSSRNDNTRSQGHQNILNSPQLSRLYEANRPLGKMLQLTVIDINARETTGGVVVISRRVIVEVDQVWDQRLQCNQWATLFGILDSLQGNTHRLSFLEITWKAPMQMAFYQYSKRLSNVQMLTSRKPPCNELLH